MTILYIDLAGRAHFVNDLAEGTPRLVFAFVSDLDQMQVFKHLFVFFDRQDNWFFGRFHL